MRYLIVFLTCLLLAGSAFADDPGVRDSLIIETVYAELGDSVADLRVYVTCDDSVFFYNMPLAWYSPDSSINPSHITYHNTLLYWDDVYDTLMYDQGFWRILAWADVSGPDNPPVITGNYRDHLWTLTFSIDSLAIPQVVTIDTTYDPIMGSLLFGLIGGTQALIPVFTPGVIFYGTTSDVSDMTQPLPQQLTLYQNYPNPFNVYTVIRYYLPEDGHVSIDIYDLLGRKVRNLVNTDQKAGTNGVTFKASDLPSGIYFYTLRSGGKTEKKRMQLLK
ncbi:MAG: T9SS type A sorting domain-containing protein [Candidatus Zixiibacteriota bacterium]|nr:MAG: T9SS type A sorting domain-containing protein [candidate division Zixibacteria bacterium]